MLKSEFAARRPHHGGQEKSLARCVCGLNAGVKHRRALLRRGAQPARAMPEAGLLFDDPGFAAGEDEVDEGEDTRMQKYLHSQ